MYFYPFVISYFCWFIIIIIIIIIITRFYGDLVINTKWTEKECCEKQRTAIMNILFTRYRYSQAETPPNPFNRLIFVRPEGISD